MYEGVDTIILYEELAYEDVLPVAWRALPEPFDPTLVGSFAEGNLRVLQTAVALDEHGALERSEEGLHAADLQRMEMKLNLMLEMLSALLSASTDRPASTAVRFNALGGVWQGRPPYPQPGHQGVFEVFLRDCIAQPLRLFGRIASVSNDGRIKVRFVPPGEHVADLLEKLAFRKHRRQVAGVRQPKK